MVVVIRITLGAYRVRMSWSLRGGHSWSSGCSDVDIDVLSHVVSDNGLLANGACKCDSSEERSQDDVGTHIDYLVFEGILRRGL